MSIKLFLEKYLLNPWAQQIQDPLMINILISDKQHQPLWQHYVIKERVCVCVLPLTAPLLNRTETNKEERHIISRPFNTLTSRGLKYTGPSLEREERVIQL